MKYFLTFFSLTLIAVSSVHAQQKEFGWLVGKWKLTGKPVYEVWRTHTDGATLIGNSYKVQGSDTIVMEKIQLKKIKNDFFYIPDMPENKSPVAFKITMQSNDGFTAENPLHDFPKIIRYQWVKRENQEFINAAIEGNGKKIPYNFTKVE
jgi:hypothetical protein